MMLLVNILLITYLLVNIFLINLVYIFDYKDGKPSVPLTASCLNTIAEECILLLRTLYNNKSIKHKNTTDVPSNFDSLITINLISAADYLANPTLEKRETVS